MTSTPANPLGDRFRGALLGLACGDALGTTVEFETRGTFPPVTDLVGGGPFGLEPGQWTDDTSMALCLATSLIERGGFDPGDQMDRYLRWYREGYLSSTGTCFDIGNTVRGALERYARTGEVYSGSTDPRSAGNGSIMRLAPVPMRFYADRAEAVRASGESSRTTHGTLECVEACRLFGDQLWRALAGASKDEILFPEPGDIAHLELRSPAILALALGEYCDLEERDLRGTGYVVRSLEAALYCFWRGADYAEAILAAVNLGDDADTTAAVCGQVAGAFWGAAGIPAPWRAQLTDVARLEELADQLLAAAAPATPPD